MATKKDLVEAYSFSRRRLVTAFVSGAPGGREVEPARPGRTIVGGLALAVLLGAGAAIAGVFSPTAPDDWKKPGLIISKDTGSAYVIVEESSDPELRPVINSTSAKLILGADAEPTLIAQDTIDDQTHRRRHRHPGRARERADPVPADRLRVDGLHRRRTPGSGSRSRRRPTSRRSPTGA